MEPEHLPFRTPACLTRIRRHPLRRLYSEMRRRLHQTPRRLDANGGTIMPGLVEAHFHPTYFNVAALEDLDIKYPVEYVTLLAAAMRSWRWNAATRRPAAAAVCSTSMCG